MKHRKPFRAVQITYKKGFWRDNGFFRVLWGADIFIHNFPVLKSFLLANVLMWIAMWVSK